MSDNKVYFHDTSFRDGTQSLWAMYQNYGMWEAVAPLMDEAGFECIEVEHWGISMLFMSQYNEPPWARYRLIEESFKKTPLMIPTFGMIHNNLEGPASSAAMHRFQMQMAQKIYKGKVKKAFFICNDRDELQNEYPTAFPIMRDEGIEPIPYICFTVLPRLTDEYMGRMTKEIAEKYKPHQIVLKDVGGLLTPERAKTLIPTMIKNANGIPIGLHSHGMSGYNEAVCVEAMKLGVRHFQTCIPPLANGPSHPNIFNVAHNARVLGLDPQINEEPLRIASERLTQIAQAENLPIGAPVLYDERVYQHKVPGGVISNLQNQLNQMDMGDQIDEVLDEIPTILEELGHPIMVTPHSQFVVTQAAMNVAMGSRWEEIPDCMIEYAMGYYGVEDTDLDNMDPELKEKLLNDPRAEGIVEKWAKHREKVANETIEDIRAEFGMEEGSTDEDLLLKMGYATEDLLAQSYPPPKTYTFDEDNQLVE